MQANGCTSGVARPLRAGALAVISAAVLACGGDDSSAPEDPYAAVAGSYTLVSLNGRTLPATVFQDSTFRVDLFSATLVIRSNRTFTETLDGQVFQGTAPPVAEQQVHNGAFTLNGKAASFSVPAANGFPAFAYSGTFAGNVLTYTDETATYRYERR